MRALHLVPRVDDTTPTVTPAAGVISLWRPRVRRRAVTRAVDLLVAQRGCTPHRALGVLHEAADRTGRTTPEEAQLVVNASRPMHAVRTGPAADLADPRGRTVRLHPGPLPPAGWTRLTGPHD